MTTKTLGVIGLGLIGGSLAKDLRIAGFTSRIIGADRSSDHTSQALELGLVDEVLPIGQLVEVCDVILVSIPVNAMVNQLGQFMENLRPGVVVIDTGSTKSQICAAMATHPHRAQFVAAHPIAGTENSGPSAALAGLFRGKTNIICERERTDPAILQVAEEVFNLVGMNTIYMEAEEHDKHVAYVSHLSHVSSFLLGQTVLDIEKDEKNIFALAGSGFASTVRLAKSSPQMWAPIFDQNMEYLSQALQEYIMHLQRFQYYLMKRDTEALAGILSKANEIRRVLDGIELKARTK